MIQLKKSRVLWLLLTPLLAALMLSGNPREEMDAREYPFAPVSFNSADSMLSKLTVRDKIAQLLIYKGWDSTVTGVSGYIITDDMPRERTVCKLDKNGLPYYVGVHLLNGTSANTALLPRKEELLASVNDTEVVTQYARAFGQHLQQNGINFIIGPSLDIYYNDNNPYTLEHSFSDTASEVVAYSRAFLEGLKSTGVVAVVGSYPGLGNMERGYDRNPPIIFSRPKQLYSNDLVPFKALINDGVQGVLIGNAEVPAVDSGNKVLAPGSMKVHATLREQLGFNGLTWSDLTLEERSKEMPVTPVDALIAGSDIVIVDGNIEKRISEIERAIEDGTLPMELIDKKCNRIIQSKLWSQKKAFGSDRWSWRKSEAELELQERKVVENALTLLRNDQDLIPLKRLDTLRLAVVHISSAPEPEMHTMLERYAPGDVFEVNFESLEEDFGRFEKAQDSYNAVIVIADPESDLPRKRMGMSEHYQSVLERLVYAQRSVLVWNGQPKAILPFARVPKLSAIIATHERTWWTSDYALQAVFGGRAMTGTLKRKIGNIYPRHWGITTEKTRLGYGMPEEVGIASEDLEKIDQIAYGGIDKKAYPGCQVWFAKDGIVVVNEAYGYHTYANEDTVRTTDLYDLASITKIAASTAALMKLTDQEKFKLDYSLCDYLGEWVDTTDYMQLGMREILAHQAGLTPFVPFYSKTLVKGVPRYDVYSLAQSEAYPNRVARELYIREGYEDIMFRKILDQKLREKKYKYSDVGYYFMLRIIEKQSGMSMVDYLDQSYYKPLGMTTLTYRPLDKFDKSRITPTEYDRHFRKQLVHGDVHDPGAAMLGGIGGHAGLFSNANDLGKLMQVFLNGGDYGGEHYLNAETIHDFVRCQFCDDDNRRGAGFDKAFMDGTEGPTCGCTDTETFGHQGFTGTVTWADPRDKVVYVFLSNRVYPDANNRKLAEMNIRTEIQKAFHRAIAQGKTVAQGE